MADEQRKDLIDVMEARRIESDRFAWAVPTVAIAGQAFLLTIALNADASPLRRLIASLAAFATLLGAWHLFWKQTFAFALYEAVIKRERRASDLPLVDRDSLLVGADTLEDRFQREWMDHDRGGNLVRSTAVDRHFLPRKSIQIRATRVWFWLFLGIAALDLALAGWAMYDLLDLGWFEDEADSRTFVPHLPFGRPAADEPSGFLHDVAAGTLSGLIAGALLVTIGYFLVDRRLNLKDRAAQLKHEAEQRQHNRRTALEALHADLISAARLMRVAEKVIPDGQIPYPIFETGTVALAFEPAIITTLDSETVSKLLNLRNRILTSNEFTRLAFDIHFGPTAILAGTIAESSKGPAGESPAWKRVLEYREQVRTALLQRIQSVEPHLHEAIDAVEHELGMTVDEPSAQRDYVGPDPIGLFAAAGADFPDPGN